VAIEQEKAVGADPAHGATRKRASAATAGCHRPAPTRPSARWFVARHPDDV